jgi:hypothetical protein
MGITRRAVNERAQGKAGRPRAEKTDFAPGESKALLKSGKRNAWLSTPDGTFAPILGRLGNGG